MEVLTPKEAAAEVGYRLKRNGAYVAGKQVVTDLGKGLGSAIESAENANIFASLLAGLPGGVVAWLTIGFTAAVSAALTQMDFLHKKDNIRKTYDEELKAKLGKNTTTVADLEAFSQKNDTMQEALQKAKRNRNYGIGMSFVASLVSLAVVKLVLPLAVGALISGIGGAETLQQLGAVGAEWLKDIGGFANFFLGGSVGLATYHTARLPVHALGDRLFKLDEKTTHDKIVSLQRDHELGKLISKSQVLSVFVEANPQIEALIAAEYGKNFDALSLPLKQQAVDEMAKFIPLEQLAHDMNTGKINVTELAFAVEGQASGVVHAPEAKPKRPGLITRVFAKFADILKRDTPEAEAFTALPMEKFNMPDGTQVAYAEGNPTPNSYVQKLQVSKQDGKGFVERYQESRVQAESVASFTHP